MLYILYYQSPMNIFKRFTASGKYEQRDCISTAYLFFPAPILMGNTYARGNCSGYYQLTRLRAVRSGNTHKKFYTCLNVIYEPR